MTMTSGLVGDRLYRWCLTMCRYSKESGSCMMLPTGYRRSRDYCSLDNRLSTDIFGDESIRSWEGAEVGLMASTLHN